MSFNWMADFVGEGVPFVAAPLESRHDVAERAGDQEVFLDEAEVSAPGRGIVGVEHPRQHLGGDFLVDGVEEIAPAEFQEVEVLVSGGVPQPERVDGSAAVSRRPGDHTGMPTITVGTFGTTVSRPSFIWNAQLSRTSTFSLGRTTSHGSPWSSQLSGCSTWRPSLIS